MNKVAEENDSGGKLSTKVDSIGKIESRKEGHDKRNPSQIQLDKEQKVDSSNSEARTATITTDKQKVKGEKNLSSKTKDSESKLTGGQDMELENFEKVGSSSTMSNQVNNNQRRSNKNNPSVSKTHLRYDVSSSNDDHKPSSSRGHKVKRAHQGLSKEQRSLSSNKEVHSKQLSSKDHMNKNQPSMEKAQQKSSKEQHSFSKCSKQDTSKKQQKSEKKVLSQKKLDQPTNQAKNANHTTNTLAKNENLSSSSNSKELQTNSNLKER